MKKAVIGYGKNDAISWDCEGSIISENNILSAAHCMESPNKGPAIKVRVGLIDLSTPGDVMQERYITERIHHPDYKPSVKYHGIALLKLDRPLELNFRARPGLEVNSQIPGKSAIASEFGKTSYKCIEYADLVYETENLPTLRMYAGSNKVSRCAIIETPLIIGGIPAKLAEFPHMAVIGYGKNDAISCNCEGSIFSENNILSAVHCMESPNKGPAIKVRVGLIDLSTPGDVMQERYITERIHHPDYKPLVKYHDIALLKLDRPLELNPRVKPACLEMNSQIPGKSAIASGFGKTSYKSNIGSNELVKVQLNLSEDDCKKSYAEDLGTHKLPNGLIQGLLCAGIMEGGKNTCQDDSGDPLQRVLAEPYCMYSIMGVTNFGKFCAFKSSPAIYTRISSYLDWFENTVWS